MTLSVYSQLKRQVVVGVGMSPGHTHMLTTLKDLFKDDINSPRRYEQIESVGELLHVLEIRDVISEDNVEHLKMIAQKLPNTEELLKMISEYQQYHVVKEQNGGYAIEVDQTPANTSNLQVMPTVATNGFSMPSPSMNISDKKMKRINERLLEELGSYWKNFARGLEIQEGVIDEIEFKEKLLSNKIMKVLEIYYEKIADPQRWFNKLCTALENIRRKDLSIKLRDIMDMNF